ncbi:hypothetical protein ASE36_19465 [Rhizobium sp. Root274]|uniref:hypothetical protein n=1 Tax=unclassified Rhizobium TaxID=2613769 RepID=UPI0007155513|nr:MULTISPECIES: hypothetical protein [unclassified Rhizobium]KQW26952.1 hypothetical protein ASC71_19610 [Rhizobium sp. Root1240]KRD27986.1 hypothetical protein ASE36_19465 [Rhizobium sp. Root274]
MQVFGLVSLLAIIFIGMWISFQRSHELFLAVSLGVAFLVLTSLGLITVSKQRRMQTDFYLAILPLLLPTVEKWSIMARRPAPQIARMPGHYFVPRNEIVCDFHIEGTRGGVPFSVTQAVLSRSADGFDDTTFCGLIIWTHLSSAFSGDFAALRRPEHQRSLWRGTVLPERLLCIENTTHLGRWAYDFVTTDRDAASLRLAGMVSAVEALLVLKLEDLPQVAIRGSDAFALLPSQRFGWDGDQPVHELDIDRHIRPFERTLSSLLETIDGLRRI